MASKGDEATKLAAEVGQTLKEGERILAPTRRPDGTLRKPIRIRAGYVPQDEVAIYQSKGALWKKEMETLEGFPPGCDPVLDGKPKTKSAKRNERKKEKRLQAALDKSKNSVNDEVSSVEDANQGAVPVEVPVEAVTSEVNKLNITTNSSAVIAPSNSGEHLSSQDPLPDIDKKIRALKKKIRLTKAQMQKCVPEELNSERLEKWAKIDNCHKELKLLEDKKAELATI